MIPDILFLVLAYATDQLYKLPKWVDKKYHGKIIANSLGNPRAFRHILKYLNTIELSGLTADSDKLSSLYSNPHDKIINLAKSLKFGYYMGKMLGIYTNTNPLASDGLTHRKFTYDNSLLCQKCSNLKYILDNCKTLDFSKLSMNSSPQVVKYLLDNKDLIDRTTMWANPGLSDYLNEQFELFGPGIINTYFLSLNPSPLTLKLSKVVSLHSYAYDTNPIFVHELINYYFNDPTPPNQKDWVYIEECTHPEIINQLSKNLSIVEYDKDGPWNDKYNRDHKHFVDILEVAKYNIYLYQTIPNMAIILRKLCRYISDLN